MRSIPLYKCILFWNNYFFGGRCISVDLVSFLRVQFKANLQTLEICQSVQRCPQNIWWPDNETKMTRDKLPDRTTHSTRGLIGSNCQLCHFVTWPLWTHLTGVYTVSPKKYLDICSIFKNMVCWLGSSKRVTFILSRPFQDIMGKN